MGDAYFSSLPYLSAKFISVDVGRGLQTPPDGPARPRMSTQVVLPEAIGQQRSDRGLLRRRQQAIDLEQAAPGRGRAARRRPSMRSMGLSFSARRKACRDCASIPFML
jgi:hypothetical protein